jgi:hypothetical protein
LAGRFRFVGRNIPARETFACGLRVSGINPNEVCMFKSFLLCASVLAFTSTAATAATVANAQSNLAGAQVVIGFDEVAVASGAAVTDQFAAFGATFSGLNYSAGFAPRPNTSGALLFRFPITNAGIVFNAAVSDATFALSSNQGRAKFTSFLNGIEVESFSASIAGTAAPGNAVGNVFGFTGSLFDEIRFTTSGSTGASFDNLSFNAAQVAAVPVPASLPLLLAGAGVLAALRRRKTS